MIKPTKKPPGKAGRQKIGRIVRIVMSPTHEAYATSEGDSNMSAGVRKCIDRCIKIDSRKPIDLTKG